MREYVLLFLSVGILAYLDPTLMVCLGVLALLVWVASYRRQKKLVLAWGITLILCGGLWLMKSKALGVGALFYSSHWTASAAIPIGISYFVFRALTLLWEGYRGSLPQVSPRRTLLYLFFLPTFFAGPVTRLEHFSRVRLSREDANRAVRRILWGIFKKNVVLGVGFRLTFDPFLLWVSGEPKTSLSVGALFSYGILQMVKAYLDLGAYTDLAVGTSRLCGYVVPENFNAPFLQPSLVKFWRSWHMSLASWCREYLFLPLLAVTRRPSFALVASMVGLGAWHAVSTSWLLWGFYHGTGLVMNGKYSRWSPAWLVVARRTALYRMASAVLTLCFVAFGYVLLG